MGNEDLHHKVFLDSEPLSSWASVGRMPLIVRLQFHPEKGCATLDLIPNLIMVAIEISTIHNLPSEGHAL